MKQIVIGLCLTVVLVSPLASAPAAPPFLLMWGSSGTGNGEFGATYGPRAADLDRYGNLYVVDRPDSSGIRVQVFDPEGRYQRHFFGAFNHGSLRGIALDGDGNIFLVNHSCNRVEKYDYWGNFLTMWGFNVAGGGGFETCTTACQCGTAGGGDGQLNYPIGAGIDADGNVYVADLWNERVVKYSGIGDFLGTWGWGVQDGTTNALQFCTSGCYAGIEGSGDGQFNDPNEIEVLGDTVYVADTLNARVQLFTRTGGLQGKHPVSNYFSGMDVSPDGDIYTAFYNINQVALYNSSGVEVASWGGSGSGIGQFDRPSSVAVSRGGDVYIVDSDNHRVQKFGPPFKLLKAELVREPAGWLVVPK